MNFEERFTVEHRCGRPTYTAYLPPVLGSFSNYKRLDTLSHVTTIENALSIISNGTRGTPINDYSVVRNYYHPLYRKPIIWMSPSTDGPVQESRYGNVSFNVNNVELINQFKHLNFYYVEFLQYVKELAVRVLVTDNNYHNQLLQFRPENQGDVICFDGAEQKWQSATTYDCQEITVEFIIEYNPTFTEIGFVSAPMSRPLITKNQDGVDEVTGKHPVFEDDNLAYLFFTFLKHFVTHNRVVRYNEFHEEMRILGNNALMESLIDNLQTTNATHPRQHVEVDPIVFNLNVDQIFQQFQFNRVFIFPNNPNIDFEDYVVVDELIKLFVFNEQNCPSAIACIVKLHDKMVNYYQQNQYFEAEFGRIIRTFLNHFTAEEGEKLKNQMIEFVQQFG